MKNAAPQNIQNLGLPFVRACAVEMHMDISQEPFYATIYKENARDQIEHPDVTQALTPTVRTPQCRHTVWRIKEEHIMII